MTDGAKTDINLRYGIVAYNDMVRDLSLWESLVSSTFMMRPHKVLTEQDDQIAEA